MKKLLKLVQGFAIILLFATTAVNSVNGISKEEKFLIKCNRKLDKIQEIESSRHYKMQKLFAQGGFPLLFGTSVGLSLLASYCISSFIKNKTAADISTTIIINVIANTGISIAKETQQYIKKSEELKEDLIITREKAMKAFQESIKK